jgi:hypothetical protein
MEEMMYLNGEKPGAGGGARGRGRGGPPGAGGRGGLLTSPAGRGVPPPRYQIYDMLLEGYRIS